MADKMGLLTEGLKINMEERGFIIRVLWVISVTATGFWFLGLFAGVGISSPFATAAEIQVVMEGQRADRNSKIAELEDQVNLENFRKTRDTEWSQVDELKLSQLVRRLDEERRRLEVIEQAIAKKGKKE